MGHHHAGLDLATDDDETVVVRAAMAGEVIRLRRNDAGYGRAVYVRHADGQQTVYAHLSAFAPKLAAEIRAREEREGQFFLAFTLRRPIPVAQGEALGYAGTSGTDLVHLHFELRQKGAPINPLTHGLPVPDTQAPALRRVLFVPRSAAAHVGGALDEVSVEVPADGRVAEPVRLDGDVVLYVEAADHIDGSPRDLTPYRIDLEVDGQPWHTTRYDEVSYADDRYTELDFHLEREARKEARFNALFSQGPRARVHAKAGRSLSRLKRGRHTARIIAADAAGNRSTASLTLEVGPAEPPCAVAIGKLAKGKTEPPPADRRWRERLLIIPIEGLCGAGERLDVQVDGRRQKLGKGFRISRLGGKPAVALDLPADKDARVEVGVAGPGGRPAWVRIDSHGLKGGARAEEGDLRFEVGDDALFFPFPTEITRAEVNPGGPGLEVVGPLYRMSNRFVPAKAFSRVALRRPPGGTGHVGVYTLDGERWWYLGGRDEETHTVGASVHPADVALMRDAAAPVIGEARVEAHPGGPRMIVPVSDLGAGLSTVEVTVDGKPAFVERQKPFDRIIWLPLHRVKPGEHRLVVKARDRSGRETVSTQTLVWPDG
ncbi:MAG: M23 family metallopeptidase [bacterium]